MKRRRREEEERVSSRGDASGGWDRGWGGVGVGG